MRHMIVTMSFVVVGLVALTLTSGTAAQEQVTKENQAVAYTCPMHAAIKVAEAGKYPKCGMALVKAQEKEASPTAGCCPCGMMGGSAKKPTSEDGMSMMKRCMAMMEKAGVTPQMMRRCQTMMQTSISIDSPSAIRGQEEVLGLSEGQKKKLAEIERNAREKALAVLTPEQQKKLSDLPSQPMAMSQMCQQMRSKMMSGEGKGGAMMICPMMSGGSSPRSGSGSKSKRSGRK